MKVENRKNNNFDLLKVIAIFMVFVLHYLNKNFGGALAGTEVYSFNYVISHFIESLSIVAVNLFVLISGYFMIDKQEVKFSKIFMILFTLVFYCFVSYIIALLIGLAKIDITSVKVFIKSIIEFWYVYIYIILYLISPFINKLINSISKRNFQHLLIISIIFFVIWPSILNNITVKDNGYGIINFIILYMVAAYIRKYGIKSKINDLCIYFGCTIMTTLCSFFMGRAYGYNFVFNFISSVALFNYFTKLEINCDFQKISKHTLGMYIIHLQPFLVEYIYHSIFKCSLYYNSNLFLIHLVTTCVIMFICCLIIDILKQKTIDKTFVKMMKKNKYYNYLFKL